MSSKLFLNVQNIRTYKKCMRTLMYYKQRIVILSNNYKIIIILETNILKFTLKIFKFLQIQKYIDLTIEVISFTPNLVKINHKLVTRI